MAQITLKIKLDIQGLRGEVSKAASEIESKLSGIGEIQIDADTSDAQAKVKSVTDEVKQTGSAADSTRQKFAQWGMILTGLQSAISLMKQSVRQIRAFIEASETQELSVKRLQLAFQQQGEVSAETARKLTEDFTKWASSMQQVTNFGDEVINKAASLTNQMLKLDNEGLKRAMIAGMDLAEALGTDLFTAMQRISTAVESGLAPFRGASREFVELLRQTNNAQERLELTLNFIESKFGGTAESMKSDLKSMDNTIGDTQEVIGKLLNQAFAPLLKVIGQLITLFNNLDPVIQSTILAISGLTAAFIALNTSMGGIPLIIGGIVTALAGSVALIENLQNRVELTGTKILDVNDSIKEVIGEFRKLSNEQLQQRYFETEAELAEKLKSKMTQLGEEARVSGMKLSELAKVRGLSEYDFQGMKYYIDLTDQETTSKIAQYEAILKTMAARNSENKAVSDSIELERLRTQTIKDDRKRELAELEIWLQESKDKYKGNSEALILINQIYQKKRSEINERYDKAEQEAKKQKAEKEKRIEEQRIKKEKLLREKELREKIQQLNYEFNLKQRAIELEIESRRLQGENEISIAIDVYNKQHALLKEMLAKGLISQEEFNLETKALYLKTLEAIKQQYLVFTDFLKDFAMDELQRKRQYTDADVQLQKYRFKQELEDLKRQLKEGEITREEYMLRRRVAEENEAEYLKQVEEDRQTWTQRLWQSSQKFLLQLLGDWLSKFAATKLAELTIEETTEAQKTAVAKTGTLARIALAGMEIVKKLALGAASILQAIGEGIASLFATLGPFAIAAIPAMIGGVLALWNGLKKILGFKTGGYTGDGDENEPAGVVHKKEYVFRAGLVQREKDNFELLEQYLSSGGTLSRLFFALKQKTNPIVNPQVVLAGIPLTVPAVTQFPDNSMMINLLERIENRLQKLEEKSGNQKVEVVGETRLADRDIFIAFKRREKFEKKRTNDL